MARAFLLLLLATVSIGAAAGETLRCGSRLIHEGDHQLKVGKLCGEPDHVEERVIHLSGYDPRAALPPDADRDQRRYYSLLLSSGRFPPPNRSVIAMPVKVWTYNYGPRRFMREVVFVNGKVKSIGRLDYGF